MPHFAHPQFSRRFALQAGTVGLLGLGMNHLEPLRALGRTPDRVKAKAVIYIFLSGGLAQQDSFDLKPDAPDSIRGEFKPIATRTPGIHICEHLPMLAQRSHLWSQVRSLTHKTNDHSAGHLMMLTGRNELPAGFNPSVPRADDWPSIAAIAGNATRVRNNLPPAIVLPERIIHRTGRVIPGQFAGQMGRQRDPWFLDACAFSATEYGAYPEYRFDHQDKAIPKPRMAFDIPHLSLPQFVDPSRLSDRVGLLQHLEDQQQTLDRSATSVTYDRQRQSVISLLTERRIQQVFDVTKAPEKVQDRYGKNVFGWSLLMAKQLVEAGVRLVQVNLGNNETWDTHGNAFPHLKNQLFPPTDRALSALLDDLHASGLLDDTLIVMAGEFGRTPRISRLTEHYAKAGRDHWGSVQTVFFAGGGVQGGRVVGSSDKIGGYPATEPHTPENMAATIYHALGIPKEAMWLDSQERPHHIYHGEPITALM